MEDLGFGVLIREIEKRFGRRVIDLILVLFLVVAFLFGLKSITELNSYFEGYISKGGWSLLYGLLGRTLVTVAVGFFAMLLGKYWMDRRLEKKMAPKLEYMEDLQESIMQEREAMLSRVESAADDLHEEAKRLRGLTD